MFRSRGIYGRDAVTALWSRHKVLVVDGPSYKPNGILLIALQSRPTYLGPILWWLCGASLWTRGGLWGIGCQ